MPGPPVQARGRAFAIEPGIGIGCTAMGLVRALLAAEIGWPVAPAAARIIIAFRRLVLWLETLQRRPCLNQGAVDREVLARQQPFDPRLRQHCGEEFGGDLAIQQPVAVGSRSSNGPTPGHQSPARRTTGTADRTRSVPSVAAPSAPNRRPATALPAAAFPVGIDGRPRPEYKASSPRDSPAQCGCSRVLPKSGRSGMLRLDRRLPKY